MRGQAEVIHNGENANSQYIVRIEELMETLDWWAKNIFYIAIPYFLLMAWELVRPAPRQEQGQKGLRDQGQQRQHLAGPDQARHAGPVRRLYRLAVCFRL